MKPNLLDIELVSVGVYTWMEDVTFKHHFRNISIRIVVRDHHLKSEKRDNNGNVSLEHINEPEDTLLVWALSDEENTKPEERGVG